MPPRNLHRPIAVVSAFAIGATSVLAGPTLASASPAGTGDVLTASNGTNVIRYEDGSPITSSGPVKEASWSSDGSRAIFIGAGGEVKTLRYDNGRSVVNITAPEAGVQYSSPVYRGDGGGLVMAVKRSGTPWELAFMPSSSSWLPVPGSPEDGRHYQHPDSGPNGEVVYQVSPNDGGAPGSPSSIGLYDSANGFRDIITNGTNPSISPDGSKVAFVRPSGSFQQIFVSDLDGGNLVQVTSNALEHDHPTWSPTGSEIAFSQGGTGVAIALPDGSTAANPTVSLHQQGIPAYQPRNTDLVFRLAGANRIGTSVSVSQFYWEPVGQGDAAYQAESVVLSRSDQFADALGGTSLAAAKKGPLLMTAPAALDPQVSAELGRILAPGKTVYLLGGTGALSTTVENQVKALGYTARRISGANRYETSIAIANAIDTTPNMVFAATGMNFPDALAAGAAAGSYDTPGSDYTAVMVLTNNATLPPATKKYLDSKYNSETEFFAIGGQANTAMVPYDRYLVSGSNRYETAREIGYWFYGGSYFAGLATGTNWPDALSGGALMATLNGPLLLTVGASGSLIPPTQEYLSEHSGSLFAGLVFGGPGVVAGSQANQTGDTISGPGGFENFADLSGGLNRVNAAGDKVLTKRPADAGDKPGTPAESEKARESILQKAGS